MGIEYYTTDKYKCRNCGYEYDPEKGDPDFEVPIDPGTKFEDLPFDWYCPWCKATKEDFDQAL